jgi:hypothetical protein
MPLLPLQLSLPVSVCHSQGTFDRALVGSLPEVAVQHGQVPIPFSVNHNRQNLEAVVSASAVR